MASVAAFALTACGGGGYGDDDNVTSDTTINITTNGPVRFTLRQGTTISEAGGAITITISRTGGSAGAINASVTGSGGTATAGQDYSSPQFNSVTSTAALVFADGDTADKSVTVSIIDDAVDEPDETFNLTFGSTDVNGNSSTSTLTFTITDNDSSPSSQPVAPANVSSAPVDGARQIRFAAPGSVAATSSQGAIPGTTLWSPSYLKTADADAGADAMLGASVAVASFNGKITTAVGAPAENGNVGSVYVYTASFAASASPSAVKITPPVPQAMRFGFAVQLSRDGNLLAVGAPDESNYQSGIGSYPEAPSSDAPKSGAVFIYARTNGTWSNAPVYIKAMDVDAQDAFGSAIALSAGGDVLVVGAPGQDSPTSQGDDFTNAAVDSGAVYIAVQKHGAWSMLNGILKATRIGDGDRFGSSVAVAPRGAMIAVGAPYEDGEAASGDIKANAGAAYLFTPNLKAGADLAIARSLRFQAANGGAEDLFGKSVTLGVEGRVLTVGARFGAAVALSVDGNTLLVGAPAEAAN